MKLMNLPALENIKGKIAPRTAIGALLILLLILAIGGAYYFYDSNQKSQKELEQIKKDPNTVAKEQATELLTEVGKVVVLPKGESPTIATVTDESKLADQPFFKNAKKGDKVLIYTEAKKAYLYRPSTKKIIEIAPVRIGEEQSKTTTKEESNPTEETP